jgi:hypothetical protein
MSGSVYLPEIEAASQTYSVPSTLLYALIGQESSFNPNAQNGNASGIAQFMPGTASEYGVDTSDANSSIIGAALYLSDLYNQTGSWASAVQAYGTVPSNGSLTTGQQNVLNIAQSLDNGVTASAGSTDGNATDASYGPTTNATVGASGATNPQPTNTGWISRFETWVGNGFFRIGFFIIAALFIIVGLSALAFGGGGNAANAAIEASGLGHEMRKKSAIKQALRKKEISDAVKMAVAE